MITNAGIQEFIVYAVVAAAMLLTLARVRRMMLRARGRCRDCATPCALKQEMEKTGKFRTKCGNKEKKIPRKGCSITKIS